MLNCIPVFFQQVCLSIESGVWTIWIVTGCFESIGHDLFRFVRSTAKLLNTWATWRIHHFVFLEVPGVWNRFHLRGCLVDGRMHKDQWRSMPWFKSYMNPISQIQSEEGFYNIIFPFEAWFCFQKWTSCWHFAFVLMFPKPSLIFRKRSPLCLQLKQKYHPIWWLSPWSGRLGKEWWVRASAQRIIDRIDQYYLLSGEQVTLRSNFGGWAVFLGWWEWMDGRCPGYISWP